MKAGQIVESYQGAFAKVVKVSEDGGMISLSAWVRSKEAAEVETVAVVTLNGFGLSQVMKGGTNVPADEPVAEADGEMVTSRASRKKAE